MKRIPVVRSPQGPLVDVEGRGAVICLCSNDYLGLGQPTHSFARGRPGAGRSTGRTASVRFICGNVLEPQVLLERDLCLAFLHTDAALTYVSCWTANAALWTRSATSAARCSPTASTTPRSSTACGSRGRATRRSTSTLTSTTCGGRSPRRRAWTAS